ncbi:MAG: right-handed parallel beta-helix repeat-containing protein [Planctomycetes bacterium]|nr:right-handed parallel beta-helix repeat-containing protein [Planctomycetota bacterium]MCC7172261.1 right-handed parallel beta-helix repeat-containing protein [Planctomycetota bacterium]
MLTPSSWIVLVFAITVPMQVVAVDGTDSLRAALRSARPGQRIELAAGEYEALFVSGLRGEPDAPIVVTAADRAHPPRFVAGVHLSSIAHVTLSDLVIERATANGLNIDDGGSITDASHHVMLERLVVRDCGGRGNEDGIKLSGVDDLAITECTIERWGRGGSGIDMVGCHRVDVTACTLRDLEDTPAASGIQCKGGSSDVAIRLCRFDHAGQRAINAGGSTGEAFFRPHDANYEAKAVVVEGCTFVGSLTPIACVGVDGVTIRFNTIVTPSKWVVRILQESTGERFVPSRGGSFTDNLIVYDGGAVREVVNVGPGTEPLSFTFARNHWYRRDDAKRSVPTLPTPEVDARGGEDPRLRPDPFDGVEDASPVATVGAHAFVDAEH